MKQKPGVIEYRYDHSSEYKELKVFGKGRPPCAVKNIKKANSVGLAISEKKKDDLLKLCRTGAIPIEFHGWYQSLPTSRRIRDYQSSDD